MDKIKYENGVLSINGDTFLNIDDSRLIPRTIAVDKNVYSVKFFSNLPAELKKTLANTYWIRISVENKKNYEAPISKKIPVVAGL